MQKVFKGIAIVLGGMLFSDSISSDNFLRFNTVRIAQSMHPTCLWSDWNAEYTTFLESARAENYNYVTTLVDPYYHNTPSTCALITTLNDYKETWKSKIQEIRGHGLRWIPQIPIGSGHNHLADGGIWDHIRQALNQNIQMNRIAFTGPTGTNGEITAPSYAPHPPGIDQSFIDLLTVLKQAYEETIGLSYLEFVMLSYDEFGVRHYSNGALQAAYILPGGGPSRYVGSTARSNVDVQYLNQRRSGGASPSQAVQDIIVSSIYRRMQMVKSVLGS